VEAGWHLREKERGAKGWIERRFRVKAERDVYIYV
jgi:hypothetical protein